MGKKRSLKWQMVGVMLLCWLVPVVLVLGTMGWYISDSMGQRAAENLTEQLSVNVRMCADRLDSAITSSRTASYDSTVKDAWTYYRRGGAWPGMYHSVQGFLDRQYRNDNRFRFAALYFIEDPDYLRVGTFNPMQGLQYGILRDFWNEDLGAVKAEAEGLGTGLAFLYRSGQPYLIRNVVDSSFQPIATLVLALNPDYYFGDLGMLSWGADVSIYLDHQAMAVKGSLQPYQQGDTGLTHLHAFGDAQLISAAAADREYELQAVVQVDTGALLSQFTGYRSILTVMLLLLLPLLVFTLVFFNRKVSQPVQALMKGAGEIEEGDLGYQLDYQPNSREFQYLTGSFNHMSGQLRHQFDRLYQEELALRDAKIKALQSHINPHFLNNTLEIINWEARLNGDSKVSKMIEALSTLLDAAIARDKRPEVSLSEEMGYVSAYLYIIDQRFGKRLSVELDIEEDTLPLPVPRLILQPVIENAVEHGIGPGGKGTIAVHSQVRDGLLLIDVENDGVLTPEDERHVRMLLAPGYDASRESSRNIGIANVNQRLRILYGEPSGLQIGFSHGRVVARLTIKLKNKGE